MVGFPYTNIENNQMHSYKGMYKKLSNRKSVAFDISFLVANMKCVCNIYLYCTSVCYIHATRIVMMHDIALSTIWSCDLPAFTQPSHTDQ